MTCVTFIARTLENGIPCAFADHQYIERLPIVRFIGTKVANLFASMAVGKVEYASTGERGVPVLVRGGKHSVGFSEKYYESIFSTSSDAGISSGT